MKNIIILLVALISVGCSGTVYTVKSPHFERFGYGEDTTRTKGILHYGMMTIESVVSYDRIRNPVTGAITHSSYESFSTGKYCKPVKKIIKENVIDYRRKYSTYYEPGIFDFNMFGASLSDGVLTSINASNVSKSNEQVVGAYVREFDDSNLVANQDRVLPMDEAKAILCTTYI